MAPCRRFPQPSCSGARFGIIPPSTSAVFFAAWGMVDGPSTALPLPGNPGVTPSNDLLPRREICRKSMNDQWATMPFFVWSGSFNGRWPSILEPRAPERFSATCFT